MVNLTHMGSIHLTRVINKLNIFLSSVIDTCMYVWVKKMFVFSSTVVKIASFVPFCLMVNLRPYYKSINYMTF